MHEGRHREQRVGFVQEPIWRTVSEAVRCVCVAPFGCAVVPEVYKMIAGLSSSMTGSGAAPGKIRQAGVELQRRTVRSGLLGELRHCGLAEAHHSPRVAQLIRDLGRFEPQVHGHDDYPRLENAEEELGGLHGVAPMDGDPVAGLQPLGYESPRQPVGGVIQFSIRHALIAAV